MWRRAVHEDEARTIVVGVDGSAGAQAAVAWAARQADADDRLVLVHAAEPDTPAPFPALPRGDRATFAPGPYLAALGTHAASAVDRHVVDGSPSTALLAAARSADLLVVGRSRRPRGAWPTAGSLTRKLLAGSHCPVVVVPETHGGDA